MKLLFDKNIELHQAVKDELVPKIAQVADLIINAYAQGRKLLLCGNGGSAADAQHIAAELVGRFKKERRGLPAIALTTDTSIMTAVANDYGYDVLFSRQIEALGGKDDILIAISTSGNSQNIIRAVEVAKFKGLKTIGFLGNDGGLLKNLVDIPLVVPSQESDRTQEIHILIGHIICRLIDSRVS
ncbi:MAG: phosphoheptose isomerase [Candidatus Nealsonbacteria bacterium RIFCSPLOWO2_01_FULL_43_32]|uniref:Phosphoheptose isomerase n=1 Tax=Candidatus Nealsonbacteria bacterium RIFCSPLOWO2_01_FULL_43_32 TaxID=1801672 RepID=A0A1G2EDX9_9BACT|nr:MAG: phosphoheptose isomerase [Candidatus Nealsonbacteria bacterium RIFCSPLOWO2_01_FULL_43_32]